MARGHDLDENLITQAGMIIDNHITISHGAECAQLKLTPEECANFGTHTYSMSGQTPPDETCVYGDAGNRIQVPQRTETKTIIFSTDGLVYGGFSESRNLCMKGAQIPTHTVVLIFGLDRQTKTLPIPEL